MSKLHLNFLAASATGHEDCCRFLTCPPLQRLTIARVLLVATRCADDSVSDFATAAREEAERRVAEPETTTSRKRSWDMLDAAIRALEVEARDAKMRLDAIAQLPRRTQRMLGWYAKQFLHPDIVARYDYIFIWDEDLGVEHFNAEAYIKLVRKHGLEISQPGLEPDKGLTWQMTKRRGDQEVHKVTEERPGWCSDPHLPPCAAFVEIMATVFSRDAWRCVWHMIQNDLVHGWGLDFALRKCVEV
ncbi:uncharacterized protein [Zea mays]|uniref:uncharacterized protein n=1 Tax=Zea mays TaxID=4577 RepID=UPI001651FA5F|nr:uncharacterized protein LOC118472289 [Zea mays]